ncbi:MAG: tetratricopeptide repeat protein [Betaproteobacteria bacterium]|nr:tetratricopeptide repeat protein [Betaproteobacteria bacterium]
MTQPARDEVLEAAGRIAGLSREGRKEEALAEGRALAAAHPARPEARFLLGSLLADLGPRPEAESVLRDCLARWPGLLPARSLLGELLFDRRDFPGALECFRAVAGTRPDDARAWNNVAVAALALGRLDETETAARRAAGLDAGSASSRLVLAKALAARGRNGEALDALRDCLSLDPGDSEALDLQGRLLAQAGAYTRAAESFRAAIAAGAGAATASRLGDTLLQAGDAPGAVRAYGEAESREGTNAAANASRALFAMHFDGARDATRLFEAHREWASRYAATPSADGFSNGREPERRLRIGYVSPRFRASSAAFLLLPVLEAHDPAGVELHCYAEQEGGDGISERIRSRAAGWTDTRALDDDALAAAIRGDGIDVVVDLAGHTPGNRLRALSRKPAPVVLTWLDYCDTTGCGAFDALLTDSLHSPPGDRQRFVERRLRLDPLRYCYAPPDYAPPVTLPPSAKGDAVTFGAFHRFAKIGPEVLRTWAELLALDPRFRLVIKNDALNDEGERERHRERLARAGLPADRLELRPASPHAQALREYGDVDIALDAFPYNGGITTLEALYMGRPVVAFAGDTLISRQSSAILRAAGLDALVAADAKAMIRLAAGLAFDRDGLARLCAGLRERLVASPVCDASAFTRRLEAAYRAAWRDWCAGRPIGESR